MIKNVSNFVCTVPVIVVQFQLNFSFLDSFEKYSNVKFH